MKQNTSPNTIGNALVLHDTFLMKGGAERMNIEIAKILEADIVTAIWSPYCYNAYTEFGYTGNTILTQEKFRKGMIGFLRMKWNFIRFFRRHTEYKNLDMYFYSNEASSCLWGQGNVGKKIFYAHSISRHLFDLYEEYLQKVPILIQPLYRIMAKFLRVLYIKEMQKMDIVFVNSKANKERFYTATGLTSHVLYPPVNTEFFSPKNNARIYIQQSIGIQLPENYFLSFARLTHIKGIDSIIRAFAKNSDKNILIIFGKNDSQLQEFLELAGVQNNSIISNTLIVSTKYPNISFLNISDNTLLPYIISEAIATVCMSKNEDFGMVAIESLACGTFVIAPNEGGYREIITSGEHGILLDSRTPQCLSAELSGKTLNEYLEIRKKMYTLCIKRAEEFSLESFTKNLLSFIQ